MSYADFLARKVREHDTYGTDVAASKVHPMLHDWQSELRRAGLLEPTGEQRPGMAGTDRIVSAITPAGMAVLRERGDR